MLTHLDPSNGRFLDSPYAQLVLATAAVIAAMVTNSGPEYAAAFLTFGQQLLPPGHGPARPAT